MDKDDLRTLPGTPQEQAWLRKRLETLSVREETVLTAAIMRHPPESIQDAINCLQSLDSYEVCFPAGSYEQLGELYLRREVQTPEDVLPYVDLQRLGEQYEDAHPGLFVGSCYVEYPKKAIEPVYRQGEPLPGEQGQSEERWIEKFAAALEYEDCRTLHFALDISRNLSCYEWVPCEELEDFAANHLRSCGVPDKLIRSGCIDLAGYAEDLLETSGYMQTSSETGYLARNGREFVYEYSTPEEPGMTMQ